MVVSYGNNTAQQVIANSIRKFVLGGKEKQTFLTRGGRVTFTLKPLS